MKIHNPVFTQDDLDEKMTGFRIIPLFKNYAINKEGVLYKINESGSMGKRTPQKYKGKKKTTLKYRLRKNGILHACEVGDLVLAAFQEYDYYTPKKNKLQI